MGVFDFFAKFLCPLFKTAFLCYNIEKTMRKRQMQHKKHLKKQNEKAYIDFRRPCRRQIHHR